MALLIGCCTLWCLPVADAGVVLQTKLPVGVFRRLPNGGKEVARDHEPDGRFFPTFCPKKSSTRRTRSTAWAALTGIAAVILEHLV